MAFRSGNNNLPQGVSLENTSFGQNQKPYTKPVFPGQPINTNVQKAKPRGGWDDEDETDQPTLKGTNGGGFQGNQTNQGHQSGNPGSATLNNNNNGDFVPKPKKGNPAVDYEIIYCDENFVAAHEFENRTINDRIQPGGARIRQPENLLNEFVTASESFQATVIGSLLFNKLGEEIPNVSKARTLFLIEAIVKKVKKYYDYFNYNLGTFREVDLGGDAQLTKIHQDIVKYIENPNKPKTIPVVTTPTVTTNTTKNLLDDGLDLLGNSPVKGKADPFAFIQKTTSDTSNHSNTQQQQQQNFELLDDFPSQQGYNNPPQQTWNNAPQTQTQSQPKKFNPFDIGVTNTNTNQGGFNQSTPFQNTQPVNNTSTPFQNTQPVNNTSTAKPSLNFKKFQSGTGSTTPSNQQNGNNSNTNQGGASGYTPANFDQLDDLLASDLNLGPSEPVSNTSTTHNAFSSQNTSQNTSGSQTFNKPAEQPTQQNQQFGTQQQTQGGFNQFNQQGSQQGSFPSQGQGFGNQPQQFGNQSQQFGGQSQQKPTFPQQQGGFPQNNAYGGQGGFQGGYPQQQGGFGGQMYPQQGFQGGYNNYYPNPQYGGYGQQQQQLPYGQFPGGQNFGGYPNQGGFPGQQQGQNGNMNQGQWQQQQGFGTGQK